MNRPLVALVLTVLYLLVAFGLRTWRHVRATGSTGFRGLSGAAGSLTWLGGVLFVVGLVAGVLAPVVGLARWLPPVVEVPTWAATAAAVTAIVGTAATYAAQVAMGTSWRIGVRDSERTELVIVGPFRWVRNPIFTCMMLTSAALAVLAPNLLGIAAWVAVFVAIELQVRCVEEPYLVRTHQDAYLSYARRVGRFVPGVGRFDRNGLSARQ